MITYVLNRFPIMYDRLQICLGAYQFTTRKIEETIGWQPHVLDFGCGVGNYLRLAGKAPELYVGIDSSKKNLDCASQRFADKGYRFVIDTNDLDSSQPGISTSVALMIGVVHHLSDHDFFSVISEFKRLRLKAILTIDPCSGVTNNPVARTLMALDRGKWIRSASEYELLFRETGLVIEQTEEEVNPPELLLPYCNKTSILSFKNC